MPASVISLLSFSSRANGSTDHFLLSRIAETFGILFERLCGMSPGACYAVKTRQGLSRVSLNSARSRLGFGQARAVELPGTVIAWRQKVGILECDYERLSVLKQR